jgi:hypothetical protein
VQGIKGLRGVLGREIAKTRILSAKKRPGIVPLYHFLYNRAANSYEDRIKAIFSGVEPHQITP